MHICIHAWTNEWGNDMVSGTQKMEIAAIFLYTHHILDSAQSKSRNLYDFLTFLSPTKLSLLKRNNYVVPLGPGASLTSQLSK